MKYLDIDGTNKDSFSIGLGSNKVELLTIDGKLYFRNFKDISRLVGSGSGGSGSTGGTIPRAWTISDTYDAGELITYTEPSSGNQSLWRVNNTITNSLNSSFNNILNYIDKISDYSGLLRKRVDNIVNLEKSNNSFVLLYDESGITSDGIINLPDPNFPVSNSITPGFQIMIQNDSSNWKSQVKKSNGVDVILVEKGVALVTLVNASTNTWSAIQIGSGSSTALASGDKLTTLSGTSIAGQTIGSIVENTNSGWVLAQDTEDHSNSEKTLGVISSISPGLIPTILLYGRDTISTYAFTRGEKYYLSKSVSGDRVLSTALDENESAYYLFESLGSQNIFFAPRRIRRPRSLGNTINQTDHGFIVGNGVYRDGVSWKKSTEIPAQQPIAVVSKVIDPNNFSIVTSGLLKLTPIQWSAVLPDVSDITGTAVFSLTAGNTYYPLTVAGVTPANVIRSPGTFTSTPPSSSSPQKRAVFTAISATEVIVSLGTEIAPSPTIGSSGPNIQINVANFQTLANIKVGSSIYYNPTLGKWDLAIANSNDKIAKAVVMNIGSPLVTATLYGEVSFGSATIVGDVLENDSDGNGGLKSGGFVPGSTYYLSDLIPGTLTRSSPLLSAPVLYATSTTSCIIQMGFQALEGGENASRMVEEINYTSGSVFIGNKAINKEYIDIFVNGNYVKNSDFVYNDNTREIIFNAGVITGGDHIEIKYFKGINIAARYNSFNATGTAEVKAPGNYPSVSGTYTPQTYINNILEITLPFSVPHKGLIELKIGGNLSTDSEYDLYGNVIVVVGSGIFDFYAVGDIFNYDILLKEEVIPNKAIYGYIGRKIITITSGSLTTLNSSVFINDIRSGVYEIFVSNDPRVGGTLYLNYDYVNTTITSFDLILPTFSGGPYASSTLGNLGTLNIVNSVNDVTLENHTGSDVTLIMYRKV